MAPKPAAHLNGTGQTNIENSQELLRVLLGQVETALYRSDTYQRANASLQTLLGENAPSSQILLKAVAREAIGLALKQFIKQYRQQYTPQQSYPETVTGQHSGVLSETETQPADTMGNRPAYPSIPHLINGSLAGISPKVRGFGKISPAPLPIASLDLDLERKERLLEIGQQIRQARQARFLSLQQLHSQTLVPLPHLEALENGCLEKLPEDIFVRGFIRRLGDALGLDGAALVASIPEPDPIKSVIPSWQRPVSESGFQLRTSHLYVGYAALVAGAVSGLSLMSGQTTPGVNAEPDPNLISPVSVAQSLQCEELNKTPGIKANQKGIAVGSDIAPPEQTQQR